MFRHDTVGRLSRVAVAAILACATTLAFAPGTKAGSGGVGFRGHVPARPNSVQPATVERVTVFSGKVLLAVPAASSGGETLRLSIERSDGRRASKLIRPGEIVPRYLSAVLDGPAVSQFTLCIGPAGSPRASCRHYEAVRVALAAR